jgi:hypothetical protein
LKSRNFQVFHRDCRKSPGALFLKLLPTTKSVT